MRKGTERYALPVQAVLAGLRRKQAPKPTRKPVPQKPKRRRR